MVKKCVQLAAVFFFAVASSALANASGQQPVSFLQLSSIAVETVPGAEHISFSFEAQKAQDSRHAVDVQKAAKKNLEYFFIALALDGQKFWVNLNPTQPDAVIDPVLKQTDLGRIILAADLRLKKDVGALTNPQASALGRQYWEKLYAKAGELGILETIPIMNRVWIVPEEAEVSEQAKQVTILKSPLRVCLESEYMPGQAQAPQDPKQQELADFARQLMRELVLPVLNQKVNEAPSYADLRAAFRSIILAQWYKKKFAQKPGSLVESAFASAVEDSDVDSPYDPSQIYKDYLVSLQKGEYNFSESNNGRLDFYLQVITRDYFSGGVDLREVKTKHKQAVQVAEQGLVYLFDFFIPKGTDRPLRLAKSTLTLKDKKTQTLAGTDSQWLAKIERLLGIVGLQRQDAVVGRHPESVFRAGLNQL